MNIIKKTFLYSIAILILAVGSFHVAAYAQSASCSATNVTDDACYVSKCTGRSSGSNPDSSSCIAYATADANAAGSPECADIANNTVYNNCCNTNSSDSPMCIAYADQSSSSSVGSLALKAALNAVSSPALKATPASAGTPTNTANNAPLNIHLENPLNGISTIPDAINKILSVVIRIALPIIIIFFIWSGFTFITARGNPTEVTKAKNIFLYTVIGTLLILGAWVITNAIIGTVNAIIN